MDNRDEGDQESDATRPVTHCGSQPVGNRDEGDLESDETRHVTHCGSQPVGSRDVGDQESDETRPVTHCGSQPVGTRDVGDQESDETRPVTHSGSQPVGSRDVGDQESDENTFDPYFILEECMLLSPDGDTTAELIRKIGALKKRNIPQPLLMKWTDNLSELPDVTFATLHEYLVKRSHQDY